LTFRIGFDGGALLHPETGVGRYTQELLRAMAGLEAPPDVRVLCNAYQAKRSDRRAGPGSVPVDAGGFPVVNPRWPGRVLRGAWSTLSWPPVERFLGPMDVFHASDWAHPPLGRGTAMVATVHDVGALDHPEWYTPDVARHHAAINASLVRRASAVITVSAFTREALLRHVDLDPERVHAVHLGVSADFRPAGPDEREAVARRMGLQGRYVLYVGTREARKNLVGLVNAFAQVAEEVPDVTLAVVGSRPSVEGRRVQGVEAWSGAEVESRVAYHALAGRVRFLGRAPRAELPALYSGAAAFAFPTRYEGFGLPVLEAMACGCPVVASNRTSVPEVAGEAALLVDPGDADAFAEGLVRVLGDGGLAASLRDRGLARAAEFSWAETARRTVEVYRSLAVQPPESVS
jgi:glycosyltransferase involved in cell wall biosynthesis